MILDKLIRRDAPSPIAHGTITSIDQPGSRVKIQISTGSEIWASYLPSDFSDLQEGVSVAVTLVNGNAFLIQRLSTGFPTNTVIMEV